MADSNPERLRSSYRHRHYRECGHDPIRKRPGSHASGRHVGNSTTAEPGPEDSVRFRVAAHTDGSNPITVYGGWSQAINAKSKNLALAKEFTAWMWLKGTERPVEWCTKLNSKFSPRKSVLEAAKSFYETESEHFSRCDFAHRQS